MAARTLTYTINMSMPPKAVHIGGNVIPFDFNSGAKLLGTLSDMVLLGKVPNGALITDGGIRFGIQGNAATTWALVLLATDANGTFTTIGTLQSSGSLTANATAVAQYQIVAPQKVSLSDDRAVQYAVLALNCTVGGSETASMSFQGYVRYSADGSNV